MVRRTLSCAVLFSFGLLADSILLKSGRTVDGTYLGGDARTVRLAIGDRVETFDTGEITQISFGRMRRDGGQGGPPRDRDTFRPGDSAQAPPPGRSDVLRPEPSNAPPDRPRRMAGGSFREVPAGTQVAIRMIDDVDSQRDTVGQTYRASVDEAVNVDGDTVIPRGADVVAKLVDDKQSGKLTGKTVLTLDLVSVTVNGRKLDIDTQEITQESESRTRQTATRSGGGAALGAIIGAIAGGGKGAAIGAVTGGAAGGAVQVLTKGQRVRIPSETRLSFTIQQPIRL